MWSNLLSAALLYGVLSTTIVVAQQFPTSGDRVPADVATTSPFAPISSPTGTDGPQNGNPDFSKGNAAATSSTPGSTASGPNGLQGSHTEGSLETNDAKATVGGDKNIEATSRNNSGPAVGSSGTSKTGAIAGGVVGGVLFLVLVGALIFFLKKRKRARDPFGSMEKSADESVVNNKSPSTLPPAPIVAASASPHSHHSPTTPNEAHALMSHYGDAQPQHIPQEVQPVIMPAKPYDVNPSSREIHGGDEDDDGVSINSPSLVTTPSPERQQEQQRSVPRLPIYQGGRKDDVGGNTPPPAL